MSFQGKKSIPRITVSPAPLRPAPPARRPEWGLIAGRTLLASRVGGALPSRLAGPGARPSLPGFLTLQGPRVPASAARNPLRSGAPRPGPAGFREPRLSPGRTRVRATCPSERWRLLPPAAAGPARRADAALCWPGLVRGAGRCRSRHSPWAARPLDALTPRREPFVRDKASQPQPLWPESLVAPNPPLTGVQRLQGKRAVTGHWPGAPAAPEPSRAETPPQHPHAPAREVPLCQKQSLPTREAGDGGGRKGGFGTRQDLGGGVHGVPDPSLDLALAGGPWGLTSVISSSRGPWAPLPETLREEGALPSPDCCLQRVLPGWVWS